VSEVLVVDTDEAASSRLLSALRSAGHEARGCSTGAGALVSARARRPDVVILEMALPDISGADVCLSLKREPATRAVSVIFVSTKNAHADRVQGLELGADDYVAKPFSVRELVLRVQALLRRSAPEPVPVRAGGLLSVDRPAHRVLVQGRDVRLTALELRLLCALQDAGRRVQTRQSLLQIVWGNERGMTARTVDTHIKRLRRKLGEAARYIRSVRGVGYSFDTPSDGSSASSGRERSDEVTGSTGA
jgi:two-component system phosphate regulon response regulator PhoB